MSDFDPLPDEFSLDEPAPAREGLPPRYRMRADAHYVDQLESSLFNTPIRLIDVGSIDLPRGSAPRPNASFVDSVREHGVLQPLLLRGRSGRYQLIAGSRRLAAAKAAGLRSVPCLVEHVGDEQARALAEATNVPAEPLEVPAQTPRADAVLAEPGAEPLLEALVETLTAVAASAGLLSRGTSLSEGVAVDLVRAEAGRALQLLQAMRLLRHETVVPRARLPVAAVVARVVAQTAAERQLRGLALEVTPGVDACPDITGDEAALAGAVSALVLAPGLLAGVRGPRLVRLAVRPDADSGVTVIVRHDGTELPAYWRSRLADEQWPEASPATDAAAVGALAVLRAARRLAVRLGGSLSVDCSDGATTLSLSLPAWQTSLG